MVFLKKKFPLPGTESNGRNGSAPPSSECRTGPGTKASGCSVRTQQKRNDAEPGTTGSWAGWQPERLRSYSTGLRARAEWTFHAIFGVVVPMNICSPGNPWLSGFGFQASGFGTAVMQHQPKALPLVDVPLDQEFSFGFNNSHPPSYALDSQLPTPNSARSGRYRGRFHTIYQ